MSRLPLAGAIAALSCAAAHAAETPYVDIPVIAELDRIVVTATLNERAIKDVASDVSVIDAEEIDRRQVQGLADLLRNGRRVNRTP